MRILLFLMMSLVHQSSISQRYPEELEKYYKSSTTSFENELSAESAQLFCADSASYIIVGSHDFYLPEKKLIDGISLQFNIPKKNVKILTPEHTLYYRINLEIDITDTLNSTLLMQLSTSTGQESFEYSLIHTEGDFIVVREYWLKRKKWKCKRVIIAQKIS